MNEKISVIIPVYNTEKYLRRCLESIINQSLKEIEIIIVNDGSPDGSSKIIDEFSQKDKRIKVINKKNGGLSSARNVGLKKAVGEYIFNIDSDDWIEQNYFIEMYSKAKKDNLDIVISDFFLDWDNGKIDYIKEFDISETDFVSGEEYVTNFIAGKIFPSVWNKMFKNSLYKDNNIEHPEYISFGEDLATTPRLGYCAKKIGKLNKAYIHYIQNPGSITNDGVMKKYNQLIDALNILEKFFENTKYKEKIYTLEISQLTDYIYRDYDIKDKFFEPLIERYIEIIKNKNIEILNLKRKNMIYFWILKKIPKKSMFRLIYKFNQLGVKIKGYIKNV
ncbi:MAG: glycosyltransferase family 2 protein [Fusobacteriaceae bacterium]